VNIRWSDAQQRFEVEFQDFAGNLESVKAHGFKTDGPPGWIWWTQKIKVLNALRANKPASGLSITPEALAVYTPLAEQEAKNDAVKKALAEARKALKKEHKKQEVLSGTPTLPEGCAWIGKENLPALADFEKTFVPPTPPALRCLTCSDPVYDYEYPEIPQCLWCHKITLDNCADIC
jgi:hypothetical protein